MSYSESPDGQVTLTISREDYDDVMTVCAIATEELFPNTMWILRLVNRLNEGNPHYTPYRVGEKKS